MCDKIPFPSKAAAKAHIREIRVQQRWRSKSLANAKNGRKYRAYECRQCGQWHLTTRPHKKWKPRQRKAS